jgi:hypothetical protein
MNAAQAIIAYQELHIPSKCIIYFTYSERQDAPSHANANEQSTTETAERDEILARRHRQDDYAGAISFGAFLILVAVFYLTIPSLLSEARSFIHDFRPVEISQNFWWLEPSTNHPVLYNTAAQFCYLLGLVQFVVLALLFTKKSSVRRKARTFSDIIFWLGAGYVFSILSNGMLAWMPFLGALIVLVGISIVIRSTILLFVFKHPS